MNTEQLQAKLQTTKCFM